MTKEQVEEMKGMKGKRVKSNSSLFPTDVVFTVVDFLESTQQVVLKSAFFKGISSIGSTRIISSSDTKKLNLQLCVE